MSRSYAHDTHNAILAQTIILWIPWLKLSKWLRLPAVVPHSRIAYSMHRAPSEVDDSSENQRAKDKLKRQRVGQFASVGLLVSGSHDLGEFACEIAALHLERMHTRAAREIEQYGTWPCS